MTTPAAAAKEDKPAQDLALNINFDDEIINGAAVTHGGARRTPQAAPEVAKAAK